MTNYKLQITNYRKRFLSAVANHLLFKDGFTLLEMTVAIGIFSALIIAAVGVTMEVSRAQTKAEDIQAIQDNIRFSLELITKEMRTGTGYALTSYGLNCGGGAAGSEISFTTATGAQRVYYLNTATRLIMRITGNTDCTQAIPFTAEEVAVSNLNFSLNGTAAGPNDGQPTVTIALKVKAVDPKFGDETNMNLETTVVQRLRDL